MPNKKTANCEMKLFLAEKPSVAVSLSKALGCNKKCDGYFEGNGNIVTFAVGHLLELKDCADYDESMKVWKLEMFPFIPEKFEYKVKPKTAKQYNIIRNLINRSDVTEIVNACDFDREGQAIFNTIFQSIRSKKPVYRMLLNEWTPNAINTALNNLKKDEEMKSLLESAKSREHADWLLGINFTSVATLKYVRFGKNYIKSQKKRALSTGRVVTPTLKLIYDRDMEIKNFVPQNYFELEAIFNNSKGEYKGLLLNDKSSQFMDKSILEKIQKDISSQKGFVKNKTVKQVKQNAPSLFNLNDLEGYITSKYSNWTPDKVDEVIQVLYEGKGNGGFVTYPRTKSRHLEATNEFISKTQKVFETLQSNHPLKVEMAFHSNKSLFDSSKVDSHGAIMPTYIIPDKLSKDEQIVYDAIVNRFLSQFMPSAVYEETEIITQIMHLEPERLFITKGKILISEGWQKLYDKQVGEDSLPPINEGDISAVVNSELLSKQTQPPKHYTAKTLFSVMENCGKKVKKNDAESQDEILKAILSGYSIGTPATKSEILAKMMNIGYTVYNGKSITITDMGIRYIDTFPVKELFDLDFTGRLEKTLSDIEHGEKTYAEFMEVINILTKHGVEMIKKSEGVVLDYSGDTSSSSSNSPKQPVGICPKCGKPVIEGKKAFGCTGYKDGCDFVIWFENPLFKQAKKKITKSLVAKLLKDGVVEIQKMYSPKKDSYYNATLKYEKAQGSKYYNWVFVGK